MALLVADDFCPMILIRNVVRDLVDGGRRYGAALFLKMEETPARAASRIPATDCLHATPNGEIHRKAKYLKKEGKGWRDEPQRYSDTNTTAELLVKTKVMAP